MEVEFFSANGGKTDEEIVIEALKKTIFEGKLSAKAVANRLGIPYKTLSRMVSPNSLKSGEPKFPLVKIPKLAEEVEIEDLLSVVCGLCGYGIIPIKNVAEDISREDVNLKVLLKQNSQLMKETSRLTDSLIQALEDGVLTKEERENILLQLSKLEKSIELLKVYIQIFE